MDSLLFLPPKPPETTISLRASRGFEYVRNTTAPAAATTSPESQTLSEEDDARLLLFMEEALLELESIQMSSGAHPNTFRDNHDEDLILDRDAHFSSLTRESKDLSLLFPRIDTEATTDVASVFNESFVAPGRTAEVQRMDDNGSMQLEETTTAIDPVDEDAIWRARWLLVVAAALYGTNFSVVKLLGDEMPVGISTSLRFGLAALATLPWLVQGFLPNLRAQIDLPNVDDKEHGPRVMATLYGLEVGFWNSIGYVAQAVGLETTLASESAFLCSMAVVIVPLLDWIAGKRMRSRQWVGALMALVGVAFLELGDVDALLSSGGGTISTGDALSMIQPFTFGLGFWRMEQAMNRFPEEAPRMTAAQLMAIFISSVLYCLWTVGAADSLVAGNDIHQALAGFQTSIAEIPTSFPWKEWSSDPAILFGLFWTGCITTALTIYMETLALESLSAAETTLIFSTEPLWGTAFAVAVMGEQMGTNAVVGAGLILSACLYSNLGVQGLKDMWTSATNHNNDSEHEKTSIYKTVNSNSKTADSSFSRSLQDHWPWLRPALAGNLAARNVVSGAGHKTKEMDEIVEELIENLADKL